MWGILREFLTKTKTVTNVPALEWGWGHHKGNNPNFTSQNVYISYTIFGSYEIYFPEDYESAFLVLMPKKSHKNAAQMVNTLEDARELCDGDYASRCLGKALP